jgi:voltage-gated potassium channel
MHPLETERTRLLVQLEQALEKPLFLLSLAWVGLTVVELTRGLAPPAQRAVIVIWIIFIADFVIKLVIAPRKLLFFRRNWIGALSLLLPAFRLLRVVRVLRLTRVARLARVTRGLRVAKFLGSVNRGMRALRRQLRRHAAGYVFAATMLVLFSGAAGLMAFESEGPNREAFATYWSSLWWTAMLMTTIASEHWPRTGGGRIVTLFISLYSLGVFSYITATLASVFLESDPRMRAERPRH